MRQLVWMKIGATSTTRATRSARGGRAFRLEPPTPVRHNSGVGPSRYSETPMTLAPAQPKSETTLLAVAEASYGIEEKARGAIFTRQSVVDFMLDLVGYTVDKNLHQTS